MPSPMNNKWFKLRNIVGFQDTKDKGIERKKRQTNNDNKLETKEYQNGSGFLIEHSEHSLGRAGLPLQDSLLMLAARSASLWMTALNLKINI